MTKLLARFLFGFFLTSSLFAQSVAYIHGDVSADGDIPSGTEAPYDQMLLDDSGNTGLSQFRDMVEGEGYTISQHYDLTTTLDADFLASFDVIIFGLHQKIWSPAEQMALDVWINAGGGILMYSDSAAGGRFNIVGIRNQTGQMAVNSILSNYGMQVAVDQGGGTRAYRPDADSPNPIIWDQPLFEGEGVSPIAIDPDGPGRALIPLDPENRASNSDLDIDPVGVSITDPIWAVIGHSQVGEGNVIAIFDRQPMWNNGPGSDINEADNLEVLRRTVRYLARDYGNSSEWLQFEGSREGDFEYHVTYRQWAGGTGQHGFNYSARNNTFSVAQIAELGDNIASDWVIDSTFVQDVSTTPFGDGESELVTVRLIHPSDTCRWFARLQVTPGTSVDQDAPTVNVAGDPVIALGGNSCLESLVESDEPVISQGWTQISGPGLVSFADASADLTSASFTREGTYVVQFSASTASATGSDLHTIAVVDQSDILFAINSGGPALVANTGFSYSADEFFIGGGPDDFPGNPVQGTCDNALYNTARSVDLTFMGYSIPMENGNVRVFLQFAETFFTRNNRRIFDVSIEGDLVIDDIDLHATAPV